MTQTPNQTNEPTLEQPRTMEREFDLSHFPGQAHLNLANISGSVDIQSGDEGVIEVVAEIDHRSGDPDHTRVEMTQAADGSVTVKTDYGESFWRWIGQSPSDVHYAVRVPRNCWLQLRCISSKAEVRGLSGRFDLSMISGNLSVSMLSGSVKANIVSGGLTADQLTGPADIETVSGRVEIHNSQFESLKVNTVSGRVQIETPLGNGPYIFHSVSGDVRLSVPAATRCTIDSTSLSGRLDTNLPITFTDKTGQKWHMQVQGGGAEVRFDSISGTLHVMGSGIPSNATPAANGPAAVFTPQGSRVETPAESKPSPSSVPVSVANAEDRAAQTRRDILDRVARGELSVEDAVNQLRG